MARKNISSGSEFEDKIGYSRAVVCHPWIIISGTTGSVSPFLSPPCPPPPSIPSPLIQPKLTWD